MTDPRELALTLAVEHGPPVITSGNAQDVVRVAELWRRYLATTTALVIVTAEVDGAAVALTHPGGTMPQIVNATVDNTTVTLTWLPADDHGNPTPDQIDVANDDAAAVVADWVLSADDRSYTGTLKKVEGTVNITLSDPSAPGLAPTEVQLVVGPGATSQIQVTATVA